MPEALRRAWLRRTALSRALFPVALLYGAVTAIHRASFRWGLRRADRVGAPVIVVGNVIAGGAGKTPVVIALLGHLQARGIAAGVVSRGYGRRDDDCRAVAPGDEAALVGDEPLLIHRSTGRPVYVAPRRADAARALLRDHPGTQVIVSDDGLQHGALARDIEICVFDERGIGNGWLLPAGPLREGWPRPVDFVLRHGDPEGISGYRVERRLADMAVRADGKRIALNSLRGQRLKAVAGIARPEVFFNMLLARGLRLTATMALPDHHDYEKAFSAADGRLLCTEKDAVKLWRHQPGAWAVPLEVKIEDAFWQAFDARLDAKLSSAHGPQTA
ncbi:tetraacyldisaccharide 4'-kinase [Caenimonas sedimenti]|uniref:Tetraacyldisaccharide 4'-kinase n=1 Tax=Caenimonas sedimenti TaxID=2596921 RepID=A0A562ZMZ2_9BURK|nr:tetraacyldisaccharide 4'-kinase [Caenimonas sedimenti]TWO69959.1 tetraacyldisaccharide 4'-kinase [Caenimonas sedimenti]